MTVTTESKIVLSERQQKLLDAASTRIQNWFNSSRRFAEHNLDRTLEKAIVEDGSFLEAEMRDYYQDARYRWHVQIDHHIRQSLASVKSTMRFISLEDEAKRARKPMIKHKKVLGQP